MPEGAPDPSPEPERTGIRAWELTQPDPSGWVGFWPHQEAPSSAEIVQAFASWLGTPLEATQAENSADTEQMLWHAIVQVPSIDAGVVIWAEEAEPLEGDMPADHPLSRCRWVVRMQTVLGAKDPAADYFLLVSLLAGSLPELLNVLDVVTGLVIQRRELDTWFLASEALPSDHFLWRVGGVLAEVDGSAPNARTAMLHTTGLARCGRPELEILELPEKHVQAGLALLNAAAGLILEQPPPAPGEAMELGPELVVALQPWQKVADTLHETSPGSARFREAVVAEGGDSLSGVRAVMCGPEPVGQFRKIWSWPQEAISRLESGHAVIYSSGRATMAAARRAQRVWSSFATAFASLKRSETAEHRELATRAFLVQAPLVDGEDPERAEQAWFAVQRFDGDRVEGKLVASPVTRRDLKQGDCVWIDREAVSDWRVTLGEMEFSPDDPSALLAEVDRMRGL